MKRLLLSLVLLSIVVAVQAKSPQSKVDRILEAEKRLQESWKRLEEAQDDLHFAADVLREEAGIYDIVVTSYNPEPGQTDASPCIGAVGVDLCDYKGKAIALSRDLVGGEGKPFSYGDKIALESNCASGEFTVLDTMNARVSRRADVFHMRRDLNFGKCNGRVYKID